MRLFVCPGRTYGNLAFVVARDRNEAVALFDAFDACGPDDVVEIAGSMAICLDKPEAIPESEGGFDAGVEGDPDDMERAQKAAALAASDAHGALTK